MSGRFRSRRSLRSDILPMAVAVAVPCLLFLSFPREALHPLPEASSLDVAPACAFVSLTADEERKIVSAARAAWQLDRGVSRCTSIDILTDALPPVEPREVLGLLAYPHADRARSIHHVPGLLPPTLAAPPPVSIAPQPGTNRSVVPFSREELLALPSDKS